MNSLPFFAVLLLLPVWGVSAQEDIIEYAATHQQRTEQYRKAGGAPTWSKYGDHRLAEAEDFLASRYPRPWTVPLVLKWFQESNDEATRVHLIRLLAASRDARAGVLLAEHFKPEPSGVRDAALDGLLDYFVPADQRHSGGSRQHWFDVEDWLAANRERLQKEAAK